MAETSRPAWSVRAPMILGLLSLVVLVGGFGTWAVTSNIAGAIIASGQIEVDQNRQAIQHPEGGVVAELAVDEGQQVEEGEILLRLDASDIASSYAVVRGQLNEVRARRARLEAERDGLSELQFGTDLQQTALNDPELADILSGQLNLFAARRDTLDREIDQLTRRTEQIASQIDGMIAQRTALERQQGLVGEELVAQQNLLERGLAQAARVLTLQREEANLLGSLGEIDASAAQAEGRITEIELSILQLETQRREEAIAELREVRVQEEELAERARALARQLDQMDLRAPVAGIVYGMTVFGPRSVVRPADPVLFLVPQDRPLVISARVEAIHVDQVFVGQEVLLRFPAFDMQTTPDLYGLVTRVSADAFVDEATGASFYETQIVLDDGQIELLGDVTLLPGMPVEAFIRTDDRTPIAYLLRPLTDYFNRAFRES
ncbi:HlyD family type I secretion periplasmic adaptor subunit [Fontisubflavum oceani]|uniref:HlyD family type I secretion periplasmic adaptor subunit n=1 Tax=Fontisubflavum oceani TaxID=2978973 RepID=UPI0025B4AC76|nr:HlyD family type I secretion periplasmic adaptor subunit [Fontisubflavum oceani]WJY22640.1 HlyD family type I secretion periplasmic adaptor subunit [Fontisubflavum oceani]